MNALYLFVTLLLAKFLIQYAWLQIKILRERKRRANLEASEDEMIDRAWWAYRNRIEKALR